MNEEATAFSCLNVATGLATQVCRKSAYMALRRMKGRHMYDAIAAILDDIHLEYRIRKKTIARTTTDNGANFVKAFAVYARKPVDSADDDAADDASDDDNDGIDAYTEPIDVYATLSEGESQSDPSFFLLKN